MILKESMEQHCDWPTLKSTFLFENCDETAILNIAECLEGYLKNYKKNEIIYHFDDQIEFAGLVLDGEVHSLMTNFSDNELLIRHFLPGSVFADAYACVPSENIDMQITAQKDCRILFLKLSNLFTEKALMCSYASRATANLLREIAHNNISQTRKVQILSQRHIRDRLLLYLSTLNRSGSNTITLPFNRQELANYLGVERSALSREMCRMKKEGLIDFERNLVYMKDVSLFCSRISNR